MLQNSVLATRFHDKITRSDRLCVSENVAGNRDTSIHGQPSHDAASLDNTTSVDEKVYARSSQQMTVVHWWPLVTHNADIIYTSEWKS